MPRFPIAPLVPADSGLPPAAAPPVPRRSSEPPALYGPLAAARRPDEVRLGSCP